MAAVAATASPVSRVPPAASAAANQFVGALAPGAGLVQPAVHTDVQVARGCSSFMQLQLVYCARVLKLFRSMVTQLVQLPFGGSANNQQPLWFALVNPRFEAPTKKMRAVLPQEVPFKSMINNCCQGGSLVAAILTGDAQLLGQALDSDQIIEPVRGPLIPGMLEVKEAAKAAGEREPRLLGFRVSKGEQGGAGPTAVAVVPNPEVGAKVIDAMGAAFTSAGGLEVNSAKVVRLDPEGAKFVS
eukprot:gene3317-3594_t